MYGSTVNRRPEGPSLFADDGGKRKDDFSDRIFKKAAEKQRRAREKRKPESR